MERKNSLRTFYEILELNKTATLDEIKCSYKKLALLYHPDRNADNPEDYHEKFIEINEAYQMLSNPIKRTWYDENMKSFHSPCVIDEKEFEIPAEYFQFSRHQKFDDSEDGFFTVYRELFDRITKQEIKFYDDPEDFHYPSFGDSKSTAESVKRFYDQWQSFCTAIEYVGQYKYDCREAPNRKIFRLMQKENHKIRDKARKLRNQTIQNLVKNLRKKDERFQQIRIASENRKKTNQNKSEQNRRGQIRKNLENLCDYREPEWASMKMLEKDLEDLEAQHMREEKKILTAMMTMKMMMKKRRKRKMIKV
ncbi:DnaJ -like protein subfamily C member 21 [Sarcoptes scabiei]|uniref:DnaJ -like protein subfamily C member 21 n=1 Tax=Sarcoptes scabiei TaxID=52283 RepID=A0A834R8M3_SARSC|nr:DnaJ -like protein subfamily C member 21 [Sarcoptes scabiei]